MGEGWVVGEGRGVAGFVVRVPEAGLFVLVGEYDGKPAGALR